MYRLPLHMVVVHKLVDMLVVYTVLYSDGEATGLLEVFVGILG